MTIVIHHTNCSALIMMGQWRMPQKIVMLLQVIKLSVVWVIPQVRCVIGSLHYLDCISRTISDYHRFSSHDEPLTLQGQLADNTPEHAELLATKWLSTRQLNDLATNDGLVFKKGKFSAQEIGQVHGAIQSYQSVCPTSVS
jgi:hypothetical protein